MAPPVQTHPGRGSHGWGYPCLGGDSRNHAQVEVVMGGTPGRGGGGGGGNRNFARAGVVGTMPRRG